MTTAYLLLGTNLGDRWQYLQAAKKAISENDCRISASSKIYESKAWGVQDQPNYLNEVIAVKTAHLPHKLLFLLLKIEAQLGRKRPKNQQWAARTIDIDLLFYIKNGECSQIKTANLQLPHPRLHLRRFTLLPLHEIAPQLVHPVFEKPIEMLLHECPDSDEVSIFTAKK